MIVLLFLSMGCFEVESLCSSTCLFLLVGLTTLCNCLPLIIASLSAFWPVTVTRDVIHLVFGMLPLKLVAADVVDICAQGTGIERVSYHLSRL